MEEVEGPRGTSRATVGVVLALAGWVATVVTSLRSGPWRPSWFDPDDPLPCASSGTCPADLAAASAGLWWWVGLTSLVVLVGVGTVVSGLSTATDGEGTAAAVARGRRPWLDLLVAGAGAGVLGAVAAPVVLVASFFSQHAVVPAALLLWVLTAWFLAGTSSLGGPAVTSPRGRAVDALVVAALGLAAGAAVVLLGAADGVDAVARGSAVTGLVTLTGVAVGWAVRDRHRASRWATAGFGVTAVVALLAAGLSAVLPAEDATVPSAVTQAAPTSAPPPTPSTPSPPPTVVPEPAPTAAPTGVAAEVPCATADLALTVGGFDAAMGARAAAVTATNTGAAACLLTGTPTVTLLQGGTPLTLVVEPGRDPSGLPGVVAPIGLAPGDSAFVLLGWRTYAGWADAETPQSVTVDLGDGSVDVPVVSAYGPAPFDIADGGTWEVAPWALSTG